MGRGIPRGKRVLWSVVALLALVGGCGYYLVPGNFRPLEQGQQRQHGDGTNLEVFDDGTVTYVQGRLEVAMRPMSDEELNRQFGTLSNDGGGPGGAMPTNAFTFGDWKDPQTGQSPQRFTVIKVAVKNYEFPKVKFDPLNTVIHSSNGRSYYPWGPYDFEEYFRRFPISFNGLGYKRFSERRDMLKRSMYPENEWVFSGQEVEGFIVFPKLHTDVSEVHFILPEFGIRFNYRDEPVETVDLEFRFKRDLKKIRNYQELAEQG